MWQQSYPVDEQKPYVGGLCEGYVEGTAGEATLPTQTNRNTNGVFPSAAAAWKANYGNGNHTGEMPPDGVKVAVHFSLKNNPYDHVAMSLGDGRIASSTQAGFHDKPYVHPSMKDLINVYTRAQGGCTYLGWSEYIGRRRVTTKGEDMKATKEQLAVLYGIAFPNQTLNGDWVKAYTGKDMSDVLNALRDDASRQNYVTYLVNNAAAFDKGDVNGFKKIDSPVYVKEQ